ncbi:MAG: lipopolysaccharide heptosyltransferase II [Thermodesulfobacteriota bacterium]
MKSRVIKKILVRTPNWVGDAVMTLPALKALSELYEGAEISILAKNAVIPIYESNPAVSEVIAYSKEHKGLRGRFRLSKKLRVSDFELAVLFQNAFDAAFISFLSRIPARVGYGRDMRSGLLTEAVPFTAKVKKLHHIEYYLNIIKALGSVESLKKPIPKLYLSVDEVKRAKEFLGEKGLTGRPLIGAAPGASFGPAKMWPAEKFAETLIKLSDQLGAVPLIFGGPGDAAVAEKVYSWISKKVPRALNLAGKTTLAECMAMLKELDIFITNDSGAMHMAAALKIPTIAIFGSTDPMLTGPRGVKTCVIIKKTKCSPCFDRVCKPGHMKCLTAITVDEVLSAAMKLTMKENSYAG